MWNSDHLKYILGSTEETRLIQFKKNIFYNVLILGNYGVGKTTLCSLLTQKNTRYEYDNYILNIIFIDSNVEKNAMNSIISSNRYDSIRTQNIDFIYLCLDINDDYMDQLNHWITFILFKMYNIPFVIVGCKYDLRNFNSIYVEKMELYAKDKGAKAYIECSSKINYNIEELVTFTRKNNEKSQKSFCNFI